MWGSASQPIIEPMLNTGSSLMDAQRAFARASRARRRAELKRTVRRQPAACTRLPVYDDDLAMAKVRPLPATGVQEIPLDAIEATMDPGRAGMFDRSFRPSRAARERWERLWLAEHRGAVLPPISVVRVGDGYAVADGHHRVS